MVSEAAIICTKDRPTELEACLASVAKQAEIPRTLVVDASRTPATRELIGRLGQESSWSGHLSLISMEPGLTRQRNTGVRAVDSDIVHFLDDDVILEPGYFPAIRQCFESHQDVIGVGGLVTNRPPHRPSRFAQLFLLDSKREGTVLPSGRNVPVYAAAGTVEVDWLSGCAMSYRRSALLKTHFDERLIGYGLGEDLELSYRLRQAGRLLITSDARLIHNESPTNRLSHEALIEDELAFRLHLVQSRVGRLRVGAYWWSVLGQLGLFTFRSSIFKGEDTAYLRATLRGIRKAVIDS